MEAMLSLPTPRFMPCERCGASVAHGEPHVCDAERLLDYELFRLRAEIDGFEDRLAEWLRTPQGAFERFYAERSRR